MKNLILVCFGCMLFNLTKAQIINGDFESYTCENSNAPTFVYDPFWVTSNGICGTSPWKISHGSPQVYPTYDNNPSNQWCGRLGGGGNNGEGLIYEYNFQKGKAYKLEFRFKSYVNVITPGDNNLVNINVIQLCNGVAIRSQPSFSESYSLPSWSSNQKLFSQSNVNAPTWQTQSITFYPVRYFSQLMFYSIDDCSDNGTPLSSKAFFFIDDIKLSCGESNKIITSNNTVGLNQSSDKLSLANTSTATGQSYTFSASQEVSILPNTTITAGSDALVKIGGLNCASEPSVCSSPSNIFIPNFVTPNGDGANDTWKVIDQSKPNFAYNAYKIYYEVTNRWGATIFCSTKYAKNYGMNGFPSGAMEWNASGVSDGAYYYLMRIFDCSPPNSNQCNAGFRSGDYCGGCIKIISGEEEDLGYIQYNGWLQIAGSSARAGSEPFDENTLSEPENYLNVYPNPVKENINYELQSTNDNDFYQMTLIDLTGKEVMHTNNQEFSGKIMGQWNIENLNSGLYQLKVRTATKVWVNKIEITK